jgi:hypothetical protein
MAALLGVLLTQRHQLKIEQSSRLQSAAEAVSAALVLVRETEIQRLGSSPDPAAVLRKSTRRWSSAAEKIAVIAIVHPSATVRNSVVRLLDAVDKQLSDASSWIESRGTTDEPNALAAAEESSKAVQASFSDLSAHLRESQGK